MAGLMNKAKNLVADKVAKMEKPTADLTDVDIKNVTRESVGLKSDVMIHNPYDHDLPILEITYRLRCGDRYLIYFLSYARSHLHIDVLLSGS